MSARLERRELYAVAHFGSSYEVMWPREMREVLTEARHWGFNSYADWFDTADLKNPRNNPKNEHLTPQVFWERKLGNFRTAAELGFGLSLVITPNHVFTDQLQPDHLADTTNPRYFGQLLCPSNPDARRVILQNYRELFEDIRTVGGKLDSVLFGALDYGGCGCNKCESWILTFAALSAEIHEIARSFFPDVKARLLGWWWTPEEQQLLSDWAEKNAPGLFDSLAAYIVYGDTAPDAGFVYPDGCAKQAFVHIGYADKKEPKDVYGHWGPVIASERIENTVEALTSGGYTGFTAYSEGVFDDVNKALLAGLSSGKYSSTRDVLEAYAERYFGAVGTDRTAWAEWLAAWGDPFCRDTQAARREFDLLAPKATQSWRLEQFACKLRLFEAHNAVMKRDEWDAERLEAAERFYAEKERLWRGVWRLGLVRHIFHDDFGRPPWRDEWRQITKNTGAGTFIDLPDEA